MQYQNDNNGFLASFSPWKQFLLLLLIILISLLATTLLSYLISFVIWGDAIMGFGKVAEEMPKTQVQFLKLTQFFSQLGVFIIPSWFFAKLLTNKPMKSLGLKEKSQWRLYLLLIIISLLSLPVINWLLDINLQMNLPKSLAGIEAWMVEKEAMGALLTEALLNDKSILGLASNLLIIAGMAAIGEELLFRGVILKFFAKNLKNIHIANVITAFLFAFIHFQFFGFLPRFFMGLMLGYIFIWSGSLWLAILMHFINNALAVFVAFLYQRGSISVSYEDFGKASNVGMLIVYILGFAIFSYLFYRFSIKPKQAITE